MLNLSQKPCTPCEDVKKALDSEANRTIAAHLKHDKSSISWSEKHKPLKKVEEYVIKQFKKTDLALDFDVTAAENIVFKTINYTTYAGFLIMHPLNYEQCVRQMSDAYGDGFKKDYVSFIKEQGVFSKYTYSNIVEEDPREALVVLPGGNKLKKHCCVGRLEKILKKHGRDNILFKKHPVSYDKIYNELSEYLGGIKFAHEDSDLYSLMSNSNYVYSTMISESALFSCVMGKKIGHYDLLQNKHLAGFSHINNILYTSSDPFKWINQTFASPKSGVINPNIDKDWKSKVDEYIDYILFLRASYRKDYV